MDLQKLDFQNLLLSPQGRIGRQNFWIGVAVLFVASLVLGWIAAGIGWAVAGVYGASILAGLVGLALAVPGYCLTVKRSNDRDYPQTYVQALFALNVAFQIKGMFFPYSPDGFSLFGLIFTLLLAAGGLWALVDLGFFEGTRGPNRYGPDPLAAPQM